MKNYSSLNKYLSDVAVLNAKLHNLHWNVEGNRFSKVHELTEGLYDEMFEAYDAVAELIKMKGEFPLVRLSDFLANTGIQELPSEAYDWKKVLEIVQADLQYMRTSALAIRAEALEEDDFTVSNMFEDYIAGFDKQLWFLKATLA